MQYLLCSRPSIQHESSLCTLQYWCSALSCTMAAHTTSYQSIMNTQHTAAVDPALGATQTYSTWTSVIPTALPAAERKPHCFAVEAPIWKRVGTRIPIQEQTLQTLSTAIAPALTPILKVQIRTQTTCTLIPSILSSQILKQVGRTSIATQ